MLSWNTQENTTAFIVKQETGHLLSCSFDENKHFGCHTFGKNPMRVCYEDSIYDHPYAQGNRNTSCLGLKEPWLFVHNNLYMY